MLFLDFTALSKGFDGGSTGRNSMSIDRRKILSGGRFFWDQRARPTLEQQVLMPIQDLVEMGITLDTLIKRVTGMSHIMPTLFTRAFGNNTINR